MRTTIAAFISFAVAVSAAGKAIVINNSLEPVYLYSVSDNISDQVTVAAGQSWSETFHRGNTVPGTAIKISKKKDALYTVTPTQIMAYTLDPARLWFSLDSVHGEPFQGQKLTLSSSGSNGDIVWPQGADVGDLVRVGKVDTDLVLTIDQGPGAAGNRTQTSQPAAQPTQSAQPSQAAKNATTTPDQKDAGGDDDEENGDDNEGDDEEQ